MTLPTLEEHTRTHIDGCCSSHYPEQLAVRNVLALQTVHSLLALLESTTHDDAQGVLNDYLRESGTGWRVQFVPSVPLGMMEPE
jgi:hypothetical protein